MESPVKKRSEAFKAEMVMTSDMNARVLRVQEELQDSIRESKMKVAFLDTTESCKRIFRTERCKKQPLKWNFLKNELTQSKKKYSYFSLSLYCRIERRAWDASR